jgi:uncharacterized integral membrane protein
MNSKLLLKVLFLMAVLLLLVLMGMNNQHRVQFYLEPILGKGIKAPAAIMYFAFFAIGVISATILNVGKKGGSSSKGKSSK